MIWYWKRLKRAGRTDLIGFDEKCLIRPRQFKKERIEETGKTNLESRINRNGQESGEHRNDRNSQGNHNNQKRQKKNGSTFRNRQQDRMEEWVKIQELLGKEKNGVGNEDEDSD